MSTFLRKALASSALLFASLSHAQTKVALGQYPMGTFDSLGADTINVGNLNVMLTVPVIHKAGRAGTNFNYDLGYNGSIWNNPTATAWAPDQNWGWSGQTAVVTGWLNKQQTSGTCTGIHGGHFPLFQTLKVYYNDTNGVSHSFAGHIRDSEGECSGDTDTLSNTWSRDGKYHLGAYTDGLPLTDVRGNLINPPINSLTGAASYTDTNGNEITSDGSGNFTDTTGATALAISGGAPSNQVYAFVDAAGNNRNVTVSYASHSVQTNFGCTGITDFPATTEYLVDTITMPNSTTYSFTYEDTPGITGKVTGRLKTITLPTGGVISYAYSGANNGINCADGSALGLTRTLSSLSTPPVRTYTRTVSGANNHTLVVDAMSYHADYDFVTTFDSTTGLPGTYQTALSVTPAGTGTPPLALATCYNAATQPCTTTAITTPITQVDQYSTWDGAVTNGSTSILDTYGDVTETDTYDYGSGTTRGSLLQQELRAFSGGQITHDSVVDASSNILKRVSYAYDGNSLQPTTGIPQHIAVTGGRGNLTSVTVYTDPHSLSSPELETDYAYFDTGSLYTRTTPDGAVTTYTYDSSTNTHPITLAPPDPNSVGLNSTSTYDPYMGTTLTSTDPNSVVTTASLQDALSRPHQILTTLGSTIIAKTTLSYTATSATAQSYQSSGVHGEQDTYLDVYGRPIRSSSQSESGAWYLTDTCYDLNGRMSFSSYPYKATSANPSAHVCSSSGDSYTYDSLGRTTLVTHGDATTTTSSSTYYASAVEKTDENGVQHIYQVDGLGRPTITCEITSRSFNGVSPTSCGAAVSGTGFVTSYAYSGLQTGITQGAQTRFFTYDGAGRLVFKSEPEIPTAYSGGAATSYAYSSNATGNVVTRTTQKANQTTLSTFTTTTTQYDLLGRVLSVTYDDSLTPTKTFTYDTTTTGFTGDYPKGRMTSASTVSGSTGGITYFGYDAQGRMTQMQQCILGPCSTAWLSLTRSYTYNWLGQPITETYNTSSTTTTTSTLNYGYNLGGQLTSVTGGQDSSVSASLYSATTETPLGPTAVTYGNGVTATLGYDVFGRRTGVSLALSSSPLYAYTATWTGQRVTASTDTVDASSATYSYDDLQHLSATSASTPLGTLNLGWTYDRYGNRLSQSALAGTTYSGTLSQPTYSVDATTNRINTSGYQYDAAGNLATDGAASYAYDAEGNLLTVSVAGTTTAAYTYDALNHRILSTVGTTTQGFGFDGSGRRATVWNSSGGLVSAQYYRGAAPLAYYLTSDSHVRFQHQDWLGTERLRTTYTGSVEGTFMSLPFGDGLTTASGADTDPYHYAGLDTDSADLHHAIFREYSNIQARWLRPDPYDGSYTMSDPQSLNRYAYVGNSVAAFGDASGYKRPNSAVDGELLGLTVVGGANAGGGWGSGWDEFEAMFPSQIYVTVTTSSGQWTYLASSYGVATGEGLGSGTYVDQFGDVYSSQFAGKGADATPTLEYSANVSSYTAGVLFSHSEIPTGTVYATSTIYPESATIRQLANQITQRATIIPTCKQVNSALSDAGHAGSVFTLASLAYTGITGATLPFTLTIGAASAIADLTSAALNHVSGCH